MTGTFEEFLMKQLRRKRQIAQLHELLKPLRDCYDGDPIWVKIAPGLTSVKPSDQTILPKIEGKIISIPPFDFR